MRLNKIKKHCKTMDCMKCLLHMDGACILCAELAKNPKDWRLTRLSNFYKGILSEVNPRKNDWSKSYEKKQRVHY